MRRAIQTFMIGMLAVIAAHASDCASLVGTCDYYQCLEMQEHCGQKGYYLKFGKHYCQKYQATEYKYTEQGKLFLDQIRTCLQDELERELIRAGELPRCGRVKKFAVATHKTCYRQYDFCSLSDSDKRHIKLTAKKELFDWQMLKFAFWLEKSCF